MNRFFGVALVAMSASWLTYGQGPNEGFVMESEGTQHLIQHSDPVYPPIAKAAHVQGTVLLQLDVDIAGNVTKVEVVGGPPMLRQAAIDSAKTWVYRPFEKDGAAAQVRVLVSVPFSLGIPSGTEKSDQAIGQAYFPKADECRAANAAGKWMEAVTKCGDLVAIASRFPDPAQRANEIRGAYQDYGIALAYSGDREKALEEFRLTTALAEKSLTPKDAEYASAYYWQAFGEHISGMPHEAERDYSAAEDSYRKAIVSLPDMKTIYGHQLARTLAYHSILADQTGRAKEAEAMRAEALALNPKALDGMPKKQ